MIDRALGNECLKKVLYILKHGQAGHIYKISKFEYDPLAEQFTGDNIYCHYFLTIDHSTSDNLLKLSR